MELLGWIIFIIMVIYFIYNLSYETINQRKFKRKNENAAYKQSSENIKEDTEYDNRIMETLKKTPTYSEQYELWMNEEKSPKPLPYKQKALLTPTEFEFYRYLRAICDHFCIRVCPKVRMEDFIEITTKKERMKYRGYIKSRHVDYLITDRSFNIICAIELDDNSHNTQEAQKVDTMKNKIYETIKLPLYRVRTSEDYKERVKEIMNYCIAVMRTRYNKKADTRTQIQ